MNNFHSSFTYFVINYKRFSYNILVGTVLQIYNKPNSQLNFGTKRKNSY